MSVLTPSAVAQLDSASRYHAETSRRRWDARNRLDDALFEASQRQSQVRVLDAALAQSERDHQTRRRETQEAIMASGLASRALERARGRLRALIAERDRVLDELRRGFYCSECHRTATEIIAGGENFFTHLRRVRGHPLPAPPELVEQRRQEFATRIAAEEASVRAAERAVTARSREVELAEQREAAARVAADAAQRRRGNAWRQLTQARDAVAARFDAWRVSCIDEDRARVSEILAMDASKRRALARLDEAFRRLAATAPSDVVERLRESWTEQRAAYLEWRRIEGEALTTHRSAVEAESDDLREQASQIGLLIPRPFWPWTTLPVVRPVLSSPSPAPRTVPERAGPRLRDMLRLPTSGERSSQCMEAGARGLPMLRRVEFGPSGARVVSCPEVSDAP